MSLGIVFDNPARLQTKVYRIDVALSAVELFEIIEFWFIPSNWVWEDIDDSIKELNPQFRRVDIDCPVEAANRPNSVIVVIVSN